MPPNVRRRWAVCPGRTGLPLSEPLPVSPLPRVLLSLRVRGGHHQERVDAERVGQSGRRVVVYCSVTGVRLIVYRGAAYRLPVYEHNILKNNCFEFVP